MTDEVEDKEGSDAGAGASFEALLGELEQVVEALERGEQPLEEALSAFERGTALAARAASVLDAAEARVTKIREGRDGELEEAPFELERA